MSTLSGAIKARSFDETGFTTAELLGNAALGVAALAVIWAALGGVGNKVISYIGAQIFK